MGRDLKISLCYSTGPLFQPTLPVWGETYLSYQRSLCHLLFQPTLPVWGETRLGRFLNPIWAFQPTLPVWGETSPFSWLNEFSRFQPTLPVWGETCNSGVTDKALGHFNPLSPCGERHKTFRYHLLEFGFQPTLPVWGETWYTYSFTLIYM